MNLTKQLLEKEALQLSNLRETLSRSNQVASNVCNILDSFDDRLAGLEATILPVYQQTINFQRRQKNTDKVLQELDHVIGYYNAAGELEHIIREHPRTVGIPAYLAAMDRLHSACQYFKSNNLQTVELENATSLFETGTDSLSKEFRNELKKCQRPLPPSVTLDLVSLEWNELTEETLNSIELVSFSSKEDLRSIACWLDAHPSLDRLTVYAKLRSEAVLQSLQALRDHQRSGSAERVGGGGTPGSGGSPTPIRSRFAKVGGLEVTPKSRSQKLSNMLERKANRMIQKATGQTGNRRQAFPSDRSLSLPRNENYVEMVQRRASDVAWNGVAAGTPGEEGIDDLDVVVYITQVTALHRLAYAELLLARQLIPENRVTWTFELLLKEPLEKLSQEAESLSNIGKRSITRGDQQTLLSLLSILRHLNSSLMEFDQLFIDCQMSLRAKFSSIINTVQETSTRALEGFVETVRSENDKGLPPDGTVHQLTSNTLVFLEQLLEFSTTLEPMLRSDPKLVAAVPSNLPKGCDAAQALLGAYIKRVLGHLGSALVSRSEFYSDSTLKAIFRLNNYNYIWKMLRHSASMDPDTVNMLPLFHYVSLVEAKCHETYENHILEQKRLYSQCWSRVMFYLVNQDDLPLSVLQAGKLKDKDRQMIKDRFLGFNKEMEELAKVQTGYSVPDRKLRESLKRDNKEYILPKYHSFYEKYINVDFAKKTMREKYIHYTPSEVATLMDQFFDIAA